MEVPTFEEVEYKVLFIVPDNWQYCIVDDNGVSRTTFDSLFDIQPNPFN